MADITGPAFVSQAGGGASMRVDSLLREAAQQTYYNLLSIDAGGSELVTAPGATITSGMTSQSTGYQIQAAVTLFGTVTPAVTGNGNTPTAAAILPQTSRPFPFTGLLVYIANNGANPINLYPNANDPSNSINGQASNVPVVLGVNTITALQCVVPGIWFADGIGEGASGSITTTVSQGNVTASGSSAATATAITQGIANVNAGTASPEGVTLPPAKAGMQVAIINNLPSSATLTVYPNGTDDINGANSATTISTGAITIFIAATNGNWYTK